MNQSSNIHKTTSTAASIVGACVALVSLTISGHAWAQTFNSGSTGADGAFDLSSVPSGTTIEFDPIHEPRLAGKDPEKDNVYHFTTITIPAGVTVHMSAKYTNGPIYWLATGAVNIGGTVNLSGEVGNPITYSSAVRVPATPGPGGYPGGVGGNIAAGARGAAQSGLGPGSGLGFGSVGNTSDPYYRGLGATLAGSTYLVPLIGGSGGGGGACPNYECWGGGGGAGGGAILVASSVSLTIASGGTIRADGGPGTSGGAWYEGGGGGGGSIRLLAPVIAGTGTLSVQGGGGTYVQLGAAGRIRLEAYQQNAGFSINGNYTTGSPLNSFVPTTPPPGIQVIGVAGQSVAPNPTGSFDTADVTINSNQSVVVNIKGHYIPVGTVPKLYIFSLEGNDQVITCSPLTGSYEDSDATAEVTFPAGYTRGYVRANWTVAQ